jgi:hypothetical protein
MNAVAGLAHHRFKAALRKIRDGFIRQPVLHVPAGAGTFED